MKVLLLEPVGGYGGMIKYNQSLLSSIRRLGFDIDLITSNDPNADKNYFNRAFGKKNIFLKACGYFFACLNTARFVLVKRISLVHLHFFHYGLKEYFILALLKLMNLKVVATLHDVSSFAKEDNDSLKVKIFKKLDGIIVHSRQAENEVIAILKRILVDVPVANIIHGAYVEDVKVFSKEKSREHLNIKADKVVFLFIGQIKDVKGLDVLLNAAALLPDEIKRTISIVVAGRPWKSDFFVYEKIIRDNRLNEVVDLRLGYIVDEDMDYYFSSADFVLLPYKKIYQSGVLLSALSYGKPVITSDLEAMCEVVKDKKTAYTFEALSSTSLAAVMIECLKQDYKLCAEVGNAGLNLMRDKFSWDDVARETVKFYNSI